MKMYSIITYRCVYPLFAPASSLWAKKRASRYLRIHRTMLWTRMLEGLYEKPCERLAAAEKLGYDV